MRILEDFWYGNIEPTEYNTSSCKEYKKLLELICMSNASDKMKENAEEKCRFMAKGKIICYTQTIQKR